MAEEKEKEWTTLWLTLKEKVPRPPDVTHPDGSIQEPDARDVVSMVAKVEKDTDSQLKAKLEPKRKKPRTIFDDLFGPPPLLVKDKGMARVYLNGGAAIVFAWMDDKPPPAKFLLETAQKAADWHKIDLSWDGEVPR